MTPRALSTDSYRRADWTASGVFEIAEGVYRVPLPLPLDGLRAVNVYVLTGPGGLTVIDSGWAIPESRELLVSALKVLGAIPSDIDRFLITHVHRDHYEQSVALRREFGFKVALGADEIHTIDYVRGDSFMPFAPQLTRLRELGAAALADELALTVGPQDHQAFVQYPDEWLGSGTIDVSGRRTLEVVPTPGHTRGHVVFHDLGAGLLFAGDHVLSTITPSIGFEAIPMADPLGRFMSSLALLRSRPDAVLLPAHGPIAQSVHERVDELLSHHEGRLRNAEAAVRHGCATAHAVAGKLTWTRRERALADLDLFNRMLAVMETAAHLDLLVARGRVTVTIEDGVRVYLPA
jgi:glyoxylase-like metal-dependent hydrolase (beta-lactamase superfamily II)